MHKGMSILMARMDSHPHEFNIVTPDAISSRRWEFVVSPLLRRCSAIAKKEVSFELMFLSDNDCITVFKKLQEVQGSHMTQRIMNELLTDPGSFDGC